MKSTPILEKLNESLSTKQLQRLGFGTAAQLPEELWQSALLQPLSNFLARPGKALRTEVLKASFHAVSAFEEKSTALPDELPLVIEALHAGSLIVDDIEDNSNVRRGELTLHRIYGVPCALNAGNWLYFWPFELLERVHMDDIKRLAAYRMVTTVLRESHYGQAIDVSLRVEQLEQAQLPAVSKACSELKTGSLFGLATGLGALYGNADPRTVDALVAFGRLLGIALQMLDDLSSLLDVSKSNKLAEDFGLGRVTWPWAWLAMKLPPREFSQLLRASEEARKNNDFASVVEKMTTYIGDYGRNEIVSQLKTAWHDLESLAGNHLRLDELRRCQDSVFSSYVTHREVA
jgi:geranylgeranyl pyrophosphate synthase